MLISAPGAEIPDLVTKREYNKLLTDLRRIIREGKDEAERAGYHNAHPQRIRLACVDAPPRDTAEGARGQRFVREQLAVARSIVVKTVKTDLHGRYVAHVFYAFNNRGIEPTFLRGRYLNQELVDKGFAKVV